MAAIVMTTKSGLHPNILDAPAWPVLWDRRPDRRRAGPFGPAYWSDPIVGPVLWTGLLEPVRQEGDGQRVVVGAVVTEDRVVVRIHEELARADIDQSGRNGRFGERPAIGAPDAYLLPFRQRPPLGHVADREAPFGPLRDRLFNGRARGGGDAHFAAPGLVTIPVETFEIICDRREGVGRRFPDVAPAVVVEVDGVFQIARRHELRLSHRSRPGP